MRKELIVNVAIAALGANTAALAQPEPDIMTPPVLRKVEISKCVCRDNPEIETVSLKGLVVDAEVSLGPDGKTAADRQATFFNVFVSDEKQLRGRTKVWHLTDPDNCGISFDYGRQYSIAVRKNDEGELETDLCLAKPKQPDAAKPAN